jgi:hypothetical protein
MNESSPVLGMMLINFVPDSVMMKSSSTLTPPNPLYSLIVSHHEELAELGQKGGQQKHPD